MVMISSERARRLMQSVIATTMFFAGWLGKPGQAGASVPRSVGAPTLRRQAAASKWQIDMVKIPAGTFWMGCTEGGFVDTTPVHRVHVNSFWIAKTEVTNEEFGRFVQATKYLTVAERKPSAKDFPGAPYENLVPGSLVFSPPARSVPLNSHYQWWRYVPGANWRHPEGPDSDIKQRAHYPVVQIAFEDAVAFAKWSQTRLPTEAEFEYAARGGLDRKPYSWGDELTPAGKWQANVWQGRFPDENKAEDGYKGTAPVASFPPNGFGLYDMTGNVWQWCSDWYDANYYRSLKVDSVTDNPQGPPQSHDPFEPGVLKKVQRGGSFLCTDQYCARYLVGARGKGEITSGCSNVGFRCASDANVSRAGAQQTQQKISAVKNRPRAFSN
jgi:formylglycine-generating enzyme required for sulfatase activity